MTAIVVTAMSFADVTYQLNGGVTNDYGWQSKSDMFAAFMTDAGATDFESLDYYLQQTNPVGLIRNKMNNAAPALSMTEKWGWLKTYIETVTEEYNATGNGVRVNLSSDGTGSVWCSAVCAFFCNVQYTYWPPSADFTQAGLPEAFQPTWKHGFCNPTTVAEGETYTLNAPYKEGQSFYGWFDNAEGTGTPVTEITPASTGTLYAVFGDRIYTTAEAKTLAEGVNATVKGVVNYIYGKNIYIQDHTGGIIVYTQESPACTVGQQIIAKGTTKTYGGVIEVSDAAILSANDAELFAPVQLETLGALLAEPLKYFGQRIYIMGLKIASYDSMNNPYVTDGIDTVQCHRMPLDNTEFPIGKRVNITAVAAYYNGFRFLGDAADIVATPLGKKDTYSYPTRGENGEYTLVNNWVISNNEDNFEVNKPGTNVRGMAAKDGKMYFTDSYTPYITVVDAQTSEMLAPIAITGEHLFEIQNEEGIWQQACIYPYNDIRFDNAGNCLIGCCATTSNTFFVYKVDLTTGEATELIKERLYDNPDFLDNGYRLDAFGVYGDVNSRAVIMATDANSFNVYKWTVTNGKAGKAEEINCTINPEDKSLLLTNGVLSVTNFGYCPQTTPISENLFYVDGWSTLPMLFDTKGTLQDDFFNCPTGRKVANNEGDTCTINTGHNGVTEFQVGDERFLLMAATNTVGTPASTFALYKITDNTKRIASLEPLWYFPANGMGIATNTSRVAIPSVEVKDNVATLYLYTGNNGYASYTFTGKATPHTYQIIGGFTDNWNLTNAIQFEEENGVLTATVPDLNGTFKIVEDRSWDMQYATNWNTHAGLKFNQSYILGAKNNEQGEPDNLSLANPFGGYKNAKLTLTDDENGNKVLTLIAGDFYKSEADWYMPSTKLGWSCDDNNKFIPVEGKENTFELLVAEFSGDFKVVYGQWAIEFGQDADGTQWEVNKEYNLQLKGINVQPSSNTTYTDVTITLVVDYEAVSAKLLITSEAPQPKTLPYQEPFRTYNAEWSYGNWSIGRAGYSFAEDHAYFNIYNNSSATLISPQIDLRGIAADKPVTLSFDLALTAFSGAGENTPPSNTQNQTFAVFVSADGADYTTQPDWIWSNNSLYHTYAAIPVKGDTYELDLSGMAGKIVRIAFFAQSTEPAGDNYLNLRNMKIDTVPMTPTHHVRLSGYNLFVNYRDNLNNEQTLTGLTSFNIDVRHGTVLTIREDAFCAVWNGWSDGESDRARTITVTSDTTLAALFTDYTIRIVAGENGYLDTGDIIGKANGCDISSINACAYANDGYYFDSWSDGVTTQCRWFYIDSDIDVTARFAAKKQVTLTVGTAPQCTAMGNTTGSCIAEAGNTVTITATPNTGYHFVEWSDGVAAPTRDIYLRSDSTLLAIFAEGTYGGKCGESLYWTWNESTGALAITGTGWMDLSNYTTWRDYNLNINSVTLPDGLKSIAYQAFYGSNLRTVVIPASVEFFGTSAFEYCRNLTRFEYLGNNAWADYSVMPNGTDMTYVKAPAGMLEGIEYNIDTVIVTNGEMDMQRLYWLNSTYLDLAKATNTTMQGSPETMVYDNCRTLILPEGLKSIGTDALRGFMRIERITIPAGVTEIGRRAFEDCRSLQSVTFAGTALRTINDWAFYNCHNLRTLSLPEGVTTIGLAAFYGCTYLTNLSLPSTLQSIDDSGFGLCAKIQSISVRAQIPPVIDAKTFEGVDRKITLAVPAGSKALYVEAPYWQEFFNITEDSTGSDNTAANNCETVRKIVRNGQVLILRGGKTYTLTGIEVR